MTICHSTGSHDDPYVVITRDREQRRPQGRPPRRRRDRPYPGDGKRLGRHHPAVRVHARTGCRKVSQGINWSPEAQAILESGCNVPAPRIQPSRSRRSSNASRISATGGSWPTSGTTTRTKGPSGRGRRELLRPGDHERPSDVFWQGAPPGSVPGRVQRNHQVVADREVLTVSEGSDRNARARSPSSRVSSRQATAGGSHF